MASKLKLVEEAVETDKQKALSAALKQIDQAFGKGSVMRLGEKPVVEIEAISTGSLSLDIALGVDNWRPTSAAAQQQESYQSDRRCRLIGASGCSPLNRRTISDRRRSRPVGCNNR